MNGLRLGSCLILLGALSGCTAVSDHLNRDEPPAVPRPVFRVDEDLNRLAVMNAISTADWTRLDVRVARCDAETAGLVPVLGSGSDPWMNELAAADSTAVLAAPSANGSCGEPQGARVSPTSTPLYAGDYVDFCVRGPATDSPPLTSVEVELRDLVTNTVLDGYIFADFARC